MFCRRSSVYPNQSQSVQKGPMGAKIIHLFKLQQLIGNFLSYACFNQINPCPSYLCLSQLFYST